MASFSIAAASVSGSARAPRTAAKAHRVAASRVPAGSLGRGRRVAACRAVAAAAATDRPVVLIDNYDSFTYNLSQYLGDLGCEHVVVKNDEKTVAEIRAMRPRGVMVGPGPGTPEDSGIALDAVRDLGPEFGVFGVCMGHQCIGQVFGGSIIRAPCGLMHGKSSEVWHTEDETTVLAGLPSPFLAARYHSLVISRDGFPADALEVTAWTADETIMAVRHRAYPKIQGVQFHPESIITDGGLQIIANWVKLINEDA